MNEATSPAPNELTDAELTRYAELIYRKIGIRIADHKRTMLTNRVRRRMRETNTDTFAAYYRQLKRLPPTDQEWHAFLQEITTHETHLFRDANQWKWFRSELLREIAARAEKTGGRRRIKIWSAACSTGDELYTCACCIVDRLPDWTNWRIQLLGTDIGVDAIAAAEDGLFDDRAMRAVSADCRLRHFIRRRKDRRVWEAKPRLKQMLRFRQHNLLEHIGERNFDVVFLKNVLIYFDNGSKRTVLENVCDVLRPGGYLVVGAAEGVGGMIEYLTRVRPWLYRAPEPPRG